MTSSYGGELCEVIMKLKGQSSCDESRLYTKTGKWSFSPTSRSKCNVREKPTKRWNRGSIQRESSTACSSLLSSVSHMMERTLLFRLLMTSTRFSSIKTRGGPQMELNRWALSIQGDYPTGLPLLFLVRWGVLYFPVLWTNITGQNCFRWRLTSFMPGMMCSWTVGILVICQITHGNILWVVIG